jgi:hypothetical protein
VFLAGLIVRINLASFAGHPGDIALFTYSARLFFETGQFDLLYPTLPLLYYIQLAFYSFYVILRSFGFTDPVFLYHTSYMVEGLFLKLPAILSDVGVFFLILRFTNKIRYASLYFLNPFTIYLSAAWGTYDSIMLLPLVFGFLLLAQDRNRLAGICFIISGHVKLFGFIPFGFLVVENIIHKRVKEALLQLAIAASVTFVVFIPYLQGGLQDFYTGFVLRFIGLGGGQTRVYNIIAVLSGTRFGGTSPYVWGGLGVAILLFLFARRRVSSVLPSMLLATSVAAIVLNVFSQSEPQWASWLVPLSILYSYVVGKRGLADYGYFFGIAMTFLTMTLTQSSGYLLTGTPILFLQGLEGFPNSLPVYVVTVFSLFLMMLGYLFLKPPRFKMEVVALTVLVYIQVYFWFSILRVISVN